MDGCGRSSTVVLKNHLIEGKAAPEPDPIEDGLIIVGEAVEIGGGLIPVKLMPACGLPANGSVMARRTIAIVNSDRAKLRPDRFEDCLAEERRVFDKPLIGILYSHFNIGEVLCQLHLNSHSS